MTLAEWPVFGAVLLYLVTIAPVKAIGFRRFNHSEPRDPVVNDPKRPLAGYSCLCTRPNHMMRRRRPLKITRICKFRNHRLRLCA